jgi:hypothetical protein
VILPPVITDVELILITGEVARAGIASLLHEVKETAAKKR